MTVNKEVPTSREFQSSSFIAPPPPASLFQGWRYSSPRIRVGVCHGHQRVCQLAYVNPQLACWRVCCVAFAR